MIAAIGGANGDLVALFVYRAQRFLVKPSHQPVDLVQRLRADQCAKWLQGERTLVESFIERHPELSQNDEGLLGFICAEYCLRIEHGEQVSAGEYATRFPQFADRLTPLSARPEAIEAAPVAANGESSEGEPTEVFIAKRRAQAETPRDRDTNTATGRLEARCPSCQESMDMAVDTTFTNLTYSSSGSHFSMVDLNQATRLAKPLSKMGRFDLIERLGMGGFGTVWKARAKELDRTVAIKIPRQGALSPEETEKFLREARAAAQLRHPGIVSVHEVGRTEDSIFIVSDFVRGLTLGDWLSGQRPTSREAAELMVQIAEALHHAHERGVRAPSLHQSYPASSLRRTHPPSVATGAIPHFQGDATGAHATWEDVLLVD